MIDDSDIPPDIAWVRDVVEEELNVQLNMLKHPMDFDDTHDVAYWVAVQLDYAYRTGKPPALPGAN